jgi:hypothetical protein
MPKYHFRTIQRRNLPSFERSNSVGYLIEGDQLCVISMTETGTSWETLSGVEIDVPDERKIVSHIRASIIGSIKGKKVFLIDVMKFGKVSFKGKPWSMRSDAIDQIIDQVDSVFSFCRPVAAQRGLIPAFDNVCKKGGLGMILWRSGFNYPFLCQRM